MDIAQEIAQELNHSIHGVKRAIKLFDEGNTLHFIARYRKDQTEGLEAEQLRLLQEKVNHLRKLMEARDKAVEKLQELGALTDVLILALEQAQSASDVDEIMKPYRSKRKTKASQAREKGYQAVADIIMGKTEGDMSQVLHTFDEAEVEIIEQTKDIIAEEAINFPECQRIAEKEIQFTPVSINYYSENDEEGKYESLQQLSGQLIKLQPHQLQAIFRAEDEKAISLSIHPNSKKITSKIQDQQYFKPPAKYKSLYQEALHDGVNRLLIGRARRATLSELKKKADERAIEVFKQNLENLLLQAPVEPNIIMGIDPGYRTGCKVAVIDREGDLLEIATIYPTPPKSDISSSTKIISSLISKHKVGFIVLGNGTGSKETRDFLKQEILNSHNINFAVISESGASVYSASKSAQEEFPELESSMRGAISLARRILDPLGELVKIDPKSLGVGQYQHDVNQKMLEESLSFVVDNCINKIGVDVLTSSKEALSHISGLNPKVAEKIIDYRKKRGLQNLNELLSIAGIGPITFNQAVGFLRLKQSENPLDSTLIHVDHYVLAHAILSDLGYSIDDWKKMDYRLRQKNMKKLNAKKYVDKEIGRSIIEDIFDELLNLGIDPRGKREFTRFENINSMDDLKEGKVLDGVIRNVVDFGAFVDIGIKENGLIHISKLSDRYISDIHHVVKVSDKVRVEVINIDHDKKRIGLKLLLLNGKAI